MLLSEKGQVFGILFTLETSPGVWTWKNSIHHFHPNNLHNSTWAPDYPLFRTPPFGAINRKDVIKKIKITLVDLQKNCARRTRSVRSYANGSTRIRIVLVPLPGLPSTGEKRRGRDLSFVASPIRYLSQVPCQRTVKVPWSPGWMFHAINSTDINRGKGRMEVDGGGGAKWFEVVKRRCAGSNLPFNALSLVSRPPLRWNTHAV